MAINEISVWDQIWERKRKLFKTKNILINMDFEIMLSISASAVTNVQY